MSKEGKWKDEAMKLAGVVLREAARNEEEEKIVLTKAPGNEEGKFLDVRVDIEYTNEGIIPYYVGRILEAAADICGTSPQKIADLSLTFLKLTKEMEGEFE